VGGHRCAPAALTSWKTWYSTYKRRDGHQGRSGPVPKTLFLLGFDPLIVQPVASRYTDWAIPAHIMMTMTRKCWNFCHDAEPNSVFVQNDIEYWQDYWLADLSNTVHSCSRHGVNAAGLSPDRPFSVKHFHTIFTLLKLHLKFQSLRMLLKRV
jgi:hypothetical protein